MRLSTHIAPTAPLQALFAEIAANGYETEVPEGRVTIRPRYAGMSRTTGAPQSAAGHPNARQTHETIVARDGRELLLLEIGFASIITALSLSGEQATVPFVHTDLYTHLTDLVAGVAPVPTGTQDLTRSEVKLALFHLLRCGTAVKVSADIDGLRLAAGVTALTWALPHLAAACDVPLFRGHFHQVANASTWAILARARAVIGDLAQPVALGYDSIYFEVAPQDAADVWPLVSPIPTGDLRLQLSGPAQRGTHL